MAEILWGRSPEGDSVGYGHLWQRSAKKTRTGRIKIWINWMVLAFKKVNGTIRIKVRIRVRVEISLGSGPSVPFARCETYVI